MVTREDFDSFLIRLGVEHEEVDEGMWTLNGQAGAPVVVVHYSPPVVLLRLKVMDLPAGDEARLAPFFRRLLELNATDIIHGSYGIEEGDVVLSDTLELETLDFHELRSSYESMLFAASAHTPKLVELVSVAHEG